MLIPKYAVSSRDECVVLALMTVKNAYANRRLDSI